MTSTFSQPVQDDDNYHIDDDDDDADGGDGDKDDKHGDEDQDEVEDDHPLPAKLDELPGFDPRSRLRFCFFSSDTFIMTNIEQ